MDPKELRRIIDETLGIYVPPSLRRKTFRGACVQILVTGAIESGLKFVEGKEGGLGIFMMHRRTFDSLWDTIYQRNSNKRISLFKTCHLPAHIGMSDTVAAYVPPAELLRTHLTLAICTAYERYMSVGRALPELVDGKYNIRAIVDHYRFFWHPKQRDKTLKQDMRQLHYYLKDEGVIDDCDFEMDLDFN